MSAIYLLVFKEINEYFVAYIKGSNLQNIDKVKERSVSSTENMTTSYPDFEDIVQSTRFEEIMQNFYVYTKRKSVSNRTMAYWLLYNKMVQVLLLFIRATRESDWQLHLSAVRLMLPWFFPLIGLIMPDSAQCIGLT